jgi:phage anti-repressor protein
MSHQLINARPGFIGGHSCQIVDGRELHDFMEVRRDFPTWIKQRIGDYGFQEHIDFEVFPISGENPQGGRPAKDYHLTLNMAKELAMVEHTPKGREARLYFIACEEELHRIKANASPADPFGLDPHACPFDLIDATKLGELRRLNRNLAQGYLVSKGITPAYVSSLLANPKRWEVAAATVATRPRSTCSRSAFPNMPVPR